MLITAFVTFNFIVSLHIFSKYCQAVNCSILARSISTSQFIREKVEISSKHFFANSSEFLLSIHWKKIHVPNHYVPHCMLMWQIKYSWEMFSVDRHKYKFKTIPTVAWFCCFFWIEERRKNNIENKPTIHNYFYLLCIPTSILY